jgi:hypothetical protein
MATTSQVTTAQQQGAPVTTSSTTRTTTATASTASLVPVTSINAGGGASGNWVADADYGGGWAATVSAPVDTSKVSNPAPQTVYQNQRLSGNLTYTVPRLTPNGPYTVRLHFAELRFSSTGQRVFNVSINGAQVLKNFDIYQSAGGENVAVIEQFSTNADSTGKITIALAATVNNVSIAGIEILSGSSTSPAPAPSATAGVIVTAIDAGGGASGNWVADADFNGGWLTTVSAPITTSGILNPAPQAVYQNQRVGTPFTYTIPKLTPNTPYTVLLQFAETWFSSAGQRLFNVSINGTQVLKNFDIYQSAGGENVAVAKQFSTNADSTGAITVAFTATVNNAAIAGIEILSGSSTGPAPAPSATATTPATSPPTSSTGADCVNSVLLPIYSGCFTGNSPFHHTYASLSSQPGYHPLSQTVANDLWAEGIGTANPGPDGWASGSPIYYSNNGLPSYTVECPAYGTCNAATSVSGKQVHIANGDYASQDGDHHIAILDLSGNEEIDMWGGYNTNWNNPGSGTEQCEVGLQNGTSNPGGHGGVAGELTCSWGGLFPFSGGGLASNGNSGVAGGYAISLYEVTSGELMRGSIHHALGIEAACADSATVYPSDHNGTDYACKGNSQEPEPNVAYGTYIHLKNSYNVATSGYSYYCKVIMTALQQYGAFYYDNNSDPGSAIRFGLDQHGNANDPWYATIFPSMRAGGDIDGNGTFDYCLQRLNASDIETANISTSLPSSP